MGKPENKKSSLPRGRKPVSGKDKPKEKGESRQEFGGPKGPEPTRYGDWERKGIVSDF